MSEYDEDLDEDLDEADGRCLRESSYLELAAEEAEKGNEYSASEYLKKAESERDN